MPFVLDSLVFLVLGMLLGWLLVRSFGKSELAPAGASVKLVRTVRTVEGHEETRLLVNESVILAASNDGVRLSEYADEVEQLEAVAARLARSMGVAVEFSRVGPRQSGDDNGISMRTLPSDDALPPAQEDDAQARRARLDQGHAGE